MFGAAGCFTLGLLCGPASTIIVIPCICTIGSFIGKLISQELSQIFKNKLSRSHKASAPPSQSNSNAGQVCCRAQQLTEEDHDLMSSAGSRAQQQVASPSGRYCRHCQAGLCRVEHVHAGPQHDSCLAESAAVGLSQRLEHGLLTQMLQSAQPSGEWRHQTQRMIQCG